MRRKYPRVYFCIRAPTISTHMPWLFIIKFAPQIKLILSLVEVSCWSQGPRVPGSQGPISKIPGVMSHVPGLQVPSPRVPVPGSWVPGSQVLGSWGLRVPGLRSWFWTVPMLAPSFQLILIYKNWYRWATSVKHDCDALCDLVPFVQFLKCEKHPWRSVALTKVATLLKVTLFHGCFSLF